MQSLSGLPLEILEMIAMFFDDPRDYGSFIRLCKYTNEINTEYFRLLIVRTLLENHVEYYQDEETGIDTTLIKKEYSTIKNTTIKHLDCVFYYNKFGSQSHPRKVINYKFGVPQSQKRMRDYFVPAISIISYDMVGSRRTLGNFELDIPYDRTGTKHGLGIIYENILDKPKQIYGAGLYFKGKRYGLWKYNIPNRKKDDAEECLNDILSFQEEGPKKLEILANASEEDMTFRLSYKIKHPLWTTTRITLKYDDIFYLGGVNTYRKLATFLFQPNTLIGAQKTT